MWKLKHTKGFSLLESLISILIMSIVFIAISNVFIGVLDAKMHVAVNKHGLHLVQYYASKINSLDDYLNTNGECPDIGSGSDFEQEILYLCQYSNASMQNHIVNHPLFAKFTTNFKVNPSFAIDGNEVYRVEIEVAHPKLNEGMSFFILKNK